MWSLLRGFLWWSLHINWLDWTAKLPYVLGKWCAVTTIWKWQDRRRARTTKWRPHWPQIGALRRAPKMLVIWLILGNGSSLKHQKSFMGYWMHWDGLDVVHQVLFSRQISRAVFICLMFFLKVFGIDQFPYYPGMIFHRLLNAWYTLGNQHLVSSRVNVSKCGQWLYGWYLPLLHVTCLLQN